MFDDDPSFNKQRAVPRNPARLRQKAIALSHTALGTYAYNAETFREAARFVSPGQLLKALHGLRSRFKTKGLPVT
jgi:hypothetical protein